MNKNTLLVRWYTNTGQFKIIEPSTLEVVEITRITYMVEKREELVIY